MSTIGNVAGLWRYPVKSMNGEELDEAFLGFAGVYGDRLFAFTSSAGLKGFPFFTAREQPQMLRYRPRFRWADKAARPVNLAEAERLGPGITPLYAPPAELIVDVETPTGEVLAIDDPRLVALLVAELAAKPSEGLPAAPALTLVRSDRALTDCRPVSIISLQTIQQLTSELASKPSPSGRGQGEGAAGTRIPPHPNPLPSGEGASEPHSSELGRPLDPRRFRANIYVDLPSAGGYGEQALVGRSLRIGSRAVIAILERDPRCKLITLDPDTGQSDPTILRHVAQAHDATAGVYAAVLVEGTLRKGDAIELLD